uniref:Uncharacterized protein n=1 Tax=Clytia hemisphaerica TaxID=252671 RepID=A0A7M5V3A3_9CNID
DVVEKESEEDEPAEESKENKDELIQKADAPTPNEEKKKEDEIVENEEEDEKERKPENDEKKRDEKLTHNDPQVGYTLRKNFIHDAFETWSPAYSISFQIKPLYIVNHWTSIIHFTTGGNSGAHGRRVPAVFIEPHTSK